jgi:hypothetical protein
MHQLPVSRKFESSLFVSGCYVVNGRIKDLPKYFVIQILDEKATADQYQNNK